MYIVYDLNVIVLCKFVELWCVSLFFCDFGLLWFFLEIVVVKVDLKVVGVVMSMVINMKFLKCDD